MEQLSAAILPLLQTQNGPLPIDTVLLIAIGAGVMISFVFGFLFLLSKQTK